jgi:hypothetical protein
MQYVGGGARTLSHRWLACEHSRQAGEVKMLAHHGLRPLWPVMLFAPWLVLGLALLLRAMRKPRDSASQSVG